jgi:hypothetical protein
MSGEATIDFLATFQKAADSVTKFTKDTQASFDEMGKKFSSVTTLLTGGLAAVGVGFSLKKAIDEAADYEEQVNRLKSALDLSGITSKKATDQLSNYANELQKTTKFGDEAVLSTASLIQSLARLPTNQLDRATKAALDLSTSLRIDLDSAARLVGKAAEGNVSSFTKFGVSIRKGKDDAETFSNTLAELEKRFGGSSEKAITTYVGATAQLANAAGDAAKQFGLIVIQNPDVIKSINETADSFSTLADSIEDAKPLLSDILSLLIRATKASADFALENNKSNGDKLLQGVLSRGGGKKTLDNSGGVDDAIAAAKDYRTELFQQNQALIATKKATEDFEKSLKALEEQKKKNAALETKRYAETVSRAQKQADDARKLKDITPEQDRAAIAGGEAFKREQLDKQSRQASIASGLIGSVGQGGAGVGGAAAGLASMAGPYGMAAGAALQFLGQGPDAVKQQTQGFIDGIPIFIDAVAESIPVLIDTLAANSGKITTALSLAMPTVATRLSIELVRQSPFIAKEFVNSLVNEAGRLITALVDGVKGAFNSVGGLVGGGGIGGFIGGIGKKLGFADGGSYIVPRGSVGIDRETVAVTGGEEFHTPSQARDMNALREGLSKLLSQGGSGGTIVHDVTIQVGLEQFAKVQFQTNKRNFRTVAK